MKLFGRFLGYTLGCMVLLYLLLCVLLYCYQEQFIFHPSTLAAEHSFYFEGDFEEVKLTTKDAEQLHGLWFKVPKTKGIVFYLHGNAGSLESWGHIAPIYQQLGYDIFILDYRGFGKSTGKIKSEQQFFADAQLAYDWLKTRYQEQQITVIGYSIGTGTAAWLAAQNQPQQLILKAPYYSLVDMMQQYYAFAPTFLLKYRFETHQYLPKVSAPITIFHGKQDRLIPVQASLRLQQFLKPTDQLIVLPQTGHHGMNDRPIYKNTLSNLLP